MPSFFENDSWKSTLNKERSKTVVYRIKRFTHSNMNFLSLIQQHSQIYSAKQNIFIWSTCLIFSVTSLYRAWNVKIGKSKLFCYCFRSAIMQTWKCKFLTVTIPITLRNRYSNPKLLKESKFVVMYKVSQKSAQTKMVEGRPDCNDK